MSKYSPKFRWSNPVHVRAVACETCPWRARTAGLAEIRSHVQRTGHNVVIEVRTKTVIGLDLTLEMSADVAS